MRQPLFGSSSSRKVPGHIKQVRGATYPPIGMGAPGSPAAGAPGAEAERSHGAGTPLAARSSSARAISSSDLGPPPVTTPQNSFGSPLEKEAQRRAKFARLLGAPIVDLNALRDASWSGIPPEHRMVAWQLLLGYLPANTEWRQTTLTRKRREYAESVPQYFDADDAERSEQQRAILHQILLDVPRTASATPLFQAAATQRALERLLYIWALRHPASGYVQGINDLVLPLYSTFVHAAAPASARTPSGELDVEAIPAETLATVEADCYWCLSRLLDSIQDHYTFAQPGIQRLVFRLREIVGRIDRPLAAHLGAQGLQFIQFAFRWMNCLLMRELSLPLVCRLFDTYLAEAAADLDAAAVPAAGAVGAAAAVVAGAGADAGGAGGGAGGESFAVLHVYVCAVLLMRWSERLQQMQFQELVMFLQHLPTEEWGAAELEEVISQAYLLKQLYHNSQAHLQSTAE